ncbi:MAG TPA: ABC transporter permease [Phototrophicaceae bacterium]|nr:ABC transporter permease [Phototrophicaceae bacterium]
MAELKGARAATGFWPRFRRLHRAWVGLILLLPIFIGAIFAHQLAPFDPIFQFRDGLTGTGLPVPPGSHYLLGTDPLGRDVLSRALYGGQVSLFVSLVANGLAALLGLLVGILAGYFGGIFDTVLMRFTDVLLAFPAILLALALTAVLRPSIGVVTVVIAVITWPALSRLVRSQVLVVRELAYVDAARSLGASSLHIVIRHILPQIITLVVIWSTLALAGTVLTEASLSFLGLGVPLPTPSWGNMIADAQSQYRSAPWLILVPGAAILMTTLGFNLLGDALRDALDPRTAQRQT